MAEKIIVTIGRKFGSGGSVIGKLLAEDLGINYYDKELLTATARESGLHEDILKEFDEKNKSLFFGYYFSGEYSVDLSLNNKVFLAQFETMKKLAQLESAVFVGRCSDYVLRDHADALNVFVHAQPAYRAIQIMREENMSKGDAEVLIENTDASRADYYKYYTSKEWDDLDNYDLTIDTETLSIDGAVELIKKAIELKQKNM